MAVIALYGQLNPFIPLLPINIFYICAFPHSLPYHLSQFLDMLDILCWLQNNARLALLVLNKYAPGVQLALNSSHFHTCLKPGIHGLPSNAPAFHMRKYGTIFNRKASGFEP